MRTVGNVLWFVFAGVWFAIGYAVSGVVLCVTIIGIPFGIQAFKLSVLSLWPFGRRIVDAGEHHGHPVVVAVPAEPRRSA